MTTNIQNLLKEKADNDLFSGAGDRYNTAEFHLLNAADSFFIAAAKALVADGLEPRLVMHFLLNSAQEIILEDKQTHTTKEAERAVREALLCHQGAVSRPRSSKTKGVYVPSTTQELASNEFKRLRKKLHEEDGVLRKEVYRTLVGNVMAMLRDSGCDEHLRKGIRDILIDQGEKMGPDPHMEKLIEKMEKRDNAA